YFRQARQLATHGFADSIGLAAASLGLEARVELNQKNYERAIELYLEQDATGDESAANSLHFVASRVFQSDQEALEPLARNPHTQRLLTAYIISHHPAGALGSGS